MDYIDTKFIGQLSVRLEQFKKKGRAVWNFRCPICGDSEKDRTKARGYLFETSDGGIMYKCHNCNAAMSMLNFIAQVDLTMKKEYIFDKFGKKKKKPDTEEDLSFWKSKKIEFKNNPLKNLIKFADLPIDHSARVYIEKRRIPESKQNLLYYTDTFKEFTNTLVPNKFPEPIKNDESRLIIPFFNSDGLLFAFQGRTLDPKNSLRYITIKIDEDQIKLYGLERVDLSKTIYVVEGPLDSLFVDNAIAMAGSDVAKGSLISGDLVFVMDNEPRNAEIVKKMNAFISDGYKICIWDSSIKEKDINDMVLAGRTVEQIKEIIHSHIYSGMQAKIILNKWKRV